VRIPTTTLSQCDSGVGVKNGINAFGKKNFLGSFAPPFAVLNDFQLLATLPARDKRAGYSEAVKVACIRDREFFETLEQHALRLARFEPESMRQLIQRCAELHVNHIAGCGDPFEMGSARPLDFGHWSAHKLEQLSGFEVRHGEAVAMGIALDVLYSRRLGWLDPAEAERVLLLLEALGFELYTKEMSQRDPRGSWRLLEGLEEFREHLGGRLTLTLLRKIGVGMEVHEIDSAQMLAALEELSTRVLSRTARPAPLAAARCAQLS
jgi:3-dehydroquinate synthase